MIKIAENSGFIQLGDNIYLKGFNEIDNASMIILKKIIGSHIKKINEKKEFKKIEIECETKKQGYETTIIFYENSSAKKSDSCKENNIFVCIDNTFKKIKV